MRRRFIAIQNSFDYKNYMTIEALSDDVALYVYIDGVEYTKDGFKWNKVFESKRLDIPKGEKYSFKRITQQGEELNTFNISGQVNLKGNCLSLLFGDNANKHTSISGYIRAFEYLFSDNASIQSVDSGFLPATTLANGCYSGMFFRCTNLTTAPELPATTLTSNCYAYMFLGCTNLNYIKALFTTLPASEYTDYWVRNVSPTGTFVKNPEATWEVYGVNGIPNGWKVVMDGEEESGGIEFPIKLYFDRINDDAEAIISYFKSLDKNNNGYIGSDDDDSVDMKNTIHFNDNMYPRYMWIEEDCIGGGSCNYLDDDSRNYDILSWYFYSDGTFEIERD